MNRTCIIRVSELAGHERLSFLVESGLRASRNQRSTIVVLAEVGHSVPAKVAHDEMQLYVEV